MPAAGRQRGAALLALLAVLVLGSAWWIVSATSNPVNRTAVDRAHNAKVLQEAKWALVGYVARQAATSGENDPGALPCPEAAGYIGGSSEGTTAGNCSLPAVGRLPWRTLGIDKLLDASGEPLWYVVSPGWAKPNSTTNTTINSNSTGQLTVDGTASAAVALIVAPGQAMSVQAATGCTARNQVRATPSSTINAADYLECYDTATASVSTTGPSSSFNDMALAVTAADVLPAIEAAVAARFESEIAPVLRASYPASAWTTYTLPFASAFADPTASAFKGTAGTLSGLLPLSYAESTPGSGSACTPGTDARCDPNFVAWTGTPTLSAAFPVPVPSPTSCSVTTVTHSPSPLTQSTRIDCSVLAWGWSSLDLPFTLTANASNVGMALREFNTAVAMTGVNTSGRSASGTLNSAGTATITLTGTASVVDIENDADCGLSGLMADWFDCYQYTISVPIFLLADRSLAGSNNASHATYGWFFRNNWHQLAYYALASGLAPGGGGSCATSSTCLQVTYHADDGKQRALIVLAGRALSTQTRSGSGVLTNWLEGDNADGGSPFTVRSATLSINRTFNDRVAVIDKN